VVSCAKGSPWSRLRVVESLDLVDENDCNLIGSVLGVQQARVFVLGGCWNVGSWRDSASPHSIPNTRIGAHDWN
jgi:hypothetical protein